MMLIAKLESPSMNNILPNLGNRRGFSKLNKKKEKENIYDKTKTFHQFSG